MRDLNQEEQVEYAALIQSSYDAWGDVTPPEELRDYHVKFHAWLRVHNTGARIAAEDDSTVSEYAAAELWRDSEFTREEYFDELKALPAELLQHMKDGECEY